MVNWTSSGQRMLNMNIFLFWYQIAEYTQTDFHIKEKVLVTVKRTNKFGLQFKTIIGFCFLLVGC